MFHCFHSICFNGFLQQNQKEMKLICVKPHSQRVVIVGEIYPLMAERTLSCCGSKVVNVGIQATSRILNCKCGIGQLSQGIWWLDRSIFAELAETPEEALEEAKVEEQPVGVSVELSI